MAGNPLVGCDIKIVWAKQHLKAIEKDVRSYVKSEPYAFPSYTYENLVVVLKPEVTVPPKVRIAGNIGDFLAAVMASLDYIMWELAGRYIDRPLVPPPDGNDTPSFPLYNDPERYKTFPGRVARYKLPPSALAEIEAVQPYNRGYEPLFLLYQLVNRDKHRLPLLTFAEIESGDLSVTYGGAPITPANTTATGMAFKAPTPETSPPDPSKMNVKAQVTTIVTFGDPGMPRKPVDVILNDIYGCVVDVFKRFLFKWHEFA